MFPLLRKILEKRGLKDITELDASEKETFDKWQKILTEEEISVENIKEFCEIQKKSIEAQYTNPDNTDKKDIYLKAALSIYTGIINLIGSKKVAREHLVKYLEQLLK